METPSRKVGASALAGALSVVVVWVFSDLADVEIPAMVASAITVILTFAVGYFVPEA
jgi:hypothetical protein